MSYRNQNYMTNRLIKETIDRNQKDYVAENEESNALQQLQSPSNNNKYNVILTKSDYDALLADDNSGLSRYYKKWPREDGIDANGNPVHDQDTEIVGHSWESAMTAPTDPAETSSFPWIVLTLNNFTGTVEFKYDGESKFTWEMLEPRQYGIASVPEDLHMTDYRLVWGTGATGTQEFNPSLLQVIFTPTE